MSSANAFPDRPSPHFSWLEFACHDGTGVPYALRPRTQILCGLALEPIRERLGAPLVVISGYRTEEYNYRIGGARHSRHVQADAADVRPVDMADMPRLISTVAWMLEHGRLPGLGGYGVYPGWIHVDARPRVGGHVARWTASSVGSEP